MKSYHSQSLIPYFIAILLCVVFFSTVVLSQNRTFLTPKGEMDFVFLEVTVNSSTSKVGRASVDPSFVYASYDISRNVNYDLPGVTADIFTPLWHTPKSRDIVAVNVVGYLGLRLLKVMLDDGSVYVLDFTLATKIRPPVATLVAPPITKKGGYGENWKKIGGDATYVLSSWYVYVFRDSVSSWQVDTTGLGGATVSDFSLDTAQYVYAATTNGVFKQHPDSSVWHRIANLPTSNFASILVDRRDRIFAANYVNYNGKGTYVSTDNGSSWTLDSAGIGTRQILGLSDDAYGSTYAIANGYEEVYRRKNNTPGWTHVEGEIDAITVNPTSISSVGGDSVLYASTSFGVYRSTDQGTTWTEDNADIPAETFYSFAKGAGGKWFTSTSLGMYSLGITDTAWTKVFPTTGYLSLLNIYTDGIGNIYTGNYNSTYLSKSSNSGSSWTPDTAGGAVVPQCIDEKGGEHAGYRVKPYGGTWSWDTVGFQVTNSPNNYIAAIASDRHGYLYISGKYFNGSAHVNGQVMRRPINGGAWVVDTAGLFSFSYLDALYPGKNGDMFGTYRPNLVHRSNNGTWSTLTLPVPAISYYSIVNMVVSVDSSGAIFLALRGNGMGASYGGLGVYFSVDSGATWKHAGLDSIFVNQLISYGDSTYAATNNGLYILTRKEVVGTGVQQVRAVPATYSLFQNYPNPFNPTTTIRYILPSRSRVILSVFNTLGQKVAELVNGIKEAGYHEVIFDGSKLASGVYLYRMQAGSFVKTRKLVVIK